MEKFENVLKIMAGLFPIGEVGIDALEDFGKKWNDKRDCSKTNRVLEDTQISNDLPVMAAALE